MAQDIKPTGVHEEVRDLNNFPTVSVPNAIVKFIDRDCSKDVVFNRTSTASRYPKLLEYFAKEGITDVPTFNQWIYFYNVYHRQKLIDDLMSGMNEYNKKATETDDEDLRNQYLKKVKSFEFRYNELSKDLLKYTNDGLNRETTRKYEGTIKHINAKDVVSIMNEPVDAEFKEKED